MARVELPTSIPEPELDLEDPPALIVPLQSPLAVYQKTYRIVETAISRDNAEMVEKFKSCSNLAQSRTYEILVQTKGTRLRDAQINTMEAWKALVKKMLTKEVEEKKPDEEKKDWKDAISSPVPQPGKIEEKNPDQVLQNIKESTPIHSLTEQDISKRFVGVYHRAMLSLVEFLGSQWINVTNAKIKLPPPYDKLTQALGLPLEMIEKSSCIDLLTIGRLLRLFRGTFCISQAEYNNRFLHALVRVDSAFFESVILTRGVKRRIQVTSIYLYNPIISSGKLQRVQTGKGCAVCEEKNIRCIHITPWFEDSHTIIYVEIPLDWLIDALQECAGEALAVYQESQDDVI